MLRLWVGNPNSFGLRASQTIFEKLTPKELNLESC
jgi:hypothetical protein